MSVKRLCHPTVRSEVRPCDVHWQIHRQVDHACVRRVRFVAAAQQVGIMIHHLGRDVNAVTHQIPNGHTHRIMQHTVGELYTVGT